MSIEFEFSDFIKLQKQANELATGRELEKAEQKALEIIKSMAVEELKRVMPVSKNVGQSGRKGSRTFTHSKNALPVAIKKVKGKKELQIGWLGKGDTGDYWYVKFTEFEFGNSKYKPTAPFRKTFTKQAKKWYEIFTQEYQKLVDERLGGV